MPQNIDASQAIAGEWADHTFPFSTPLTIAAHWNKETKELVDAIVASMGKPGDREATAEVAEEAADCLGLLYHLAHRYGFSLLDEWAKKHEKNKRRQWQPPDKDGVSYHAEDEDE
jgi:NTP pyrophosphatase (non-canonical NTP hydrolase)